MYSEINSALNIGLNCHIVKVEVDVSGSWPNFSIIGLPDASVNEAKERIRTAWKNSGLSFPTNSRVVVNLSPASIKKFGSNFDLAIALAIFLSISKTKNNLEDSLFIGELGLDGSVKSVRGVLPPILLFAKKMGFRKFYIPKKNLAEASLVEDIDVYPLNNLSELLGIIKGENAPPHIFKTQKLEQNWCGFDFSQVAGQSKAKRALEIAASGGHNILLSGPPGCGKTLLAKCLPGILPPLTKKEVIEITAIHSVAGELKEEGFCLFRPFRNPHHSASLTSLVGGGATLRPGEISLAHRGVLLMDEFPEFPKSVLESLRQPLEDGTIKISRAKGSTTYPAQFTLVATQNPCPCGYKGSRVPACTCSKSMIDKYTKKISGPLLDRIDLTVKLKKLPVDDILDKTSSESSGQVRKRVTKAREIQIDRFEGSKQVCNADMTQKEIQKFCRLDKEGSELLKKAITGYGLSARAHSRILKVARTIADLNKSEEIKAPHISEALQYRTS